MRVVIAREAQIELAEIWNWNADRWGVRHADAYLAFLDRELESLTSQHGLGRQVGNRSDLWYIQMRRKPKGNANIAVYTVSDQEVTVLHVFHSAQDWARQFAGEFGE